MLKLSHVKKTFNRGTVTEKRALTGVDLTLADGDFVTVIGGNGAGKSTLLNMIAGVYPLDSGTIELDGEDISRLSEPKRAKYLGRVFQDPMRGTAADMQIEENLALAKRRGQRRGLRWGITKDERAEYAELLKRLDLGLETRMQAKVGLLSGGQRQALTLLMATLTNPRVLLLDEHTAALDPKTASKVLELTEQIVGERQLTTLMVTHNMNDHDARGSCDLRRGRGGEARAHGARPAAEVRGGFRRRARQRPHAAELAPAIRTEVHMYARRGAAVLTDTAAPRSMEPRWRRAQRQSWHLTQT